MLALAASLALAAPGGFYLSPDIHENKVAFSSEGDLWLGDLTTRSAVRLTSDPGVENFPRFSPDGKWIAFHGEYDGVRQAYVISVDGGMPRQLSNVPNFRATLGWTADGKSVAFRARGVPGGYQAYTVPAAGGASTNLPLEFVSHVEFGPEDGDYALTRFARFYMAWFRYIGGLQNQIWVQKGGKFRQITNISGTNEFPAWVGNQIYFANEQESNFTLMSVPAAGGSPKKLAGPYDVEIRNVAGDGSRVVYEKGSELEMFDPKTGKSEVLEFNRVSDGMHMRTFRTPADRLAGAFSMGAGGKRVFAESRGQIVSLPVGEGEARVWKTEPGARLRQPVVSADGKRIAYLSDRTGEFQLMVANADGTGEKTLTTDTGRQLVNYRWSPDGSFLTVSDSKMNFFTVNATTGTRKEIDHCPLAWFGPAYDISTDSKWVAYIKSEPWSLLTQLYLYSVDSGVTTRVSDLRANEIDCSFSRDGKYLALLSQRSFGVRFDSILNQLNTGSTNVAYLLPLSSATTDPFALKDAGEEDKKPDETKRPLEIAGFYERRIEVPGNLAAATGLAMNATRILFNANGAVNFFEVASKTTGVVTPGGGFTLSADGTKLLVGARVVDANGKDLPATTGAASFGGLTLEIEPVREWRQIFWDAWRLLRDYFYVVNMHGLNWKQVGDKYAAMLSRVRSRSELDELIRWMQAEIGSSHMYLTTGDARDIKPRVAPAFLGVDLAPDASGYYKIARVLRGDGFRASERSPLADPILKVKDGSFLIEVAGVPARVGANFLRGLDGRAGQVVSVKVNDKPSADGARTLLIKPLASEDRLRYVTWVEDNRQYVDKASGGKVGYIHMAAMTGNDMADFIKQYFPQRDKIALVMDTRFNNGGNVQEQVNRILSATLNGFFNMRNSKLPWSRQGDYFDGPIACVQNEYNISCGEEFPFRFRDLKIGAVIGRRTMGGEVGSDPGWPLADGGEVSVSNYGMFTPEQGWVIEGRGVEPDIDVPSDPNAYVAGRDPQLDKAVDWLLKEAAKKPRRSYAIPADRVRTGGG